MASGFEESASATTSESATTGSGTDTATPSYADGTFSATGTYAAPSGTETIEVELTIADGVVTAVAVDGDATDSQAARFQDAFASAISSEVVGEDLATLSVTRVAGASLTSQGFDSALDEIRSLAS